MSSVLLASNANSALINTLDQSPSKANPQVYSLDKMYPFSSIQYVTHNPTNSSVVLGQSNTFDVLKYGISSQFVLEFEYNKKNTAISGEADANSAQTHHPALQLIDNVELVSSSRVIQRLTRADLLAIASDGDWEYKSGFNEGVGEGGDSGSAKAISGTTNFERAYINLAFPLLANARTQLNTTFLEPQRIVVNWSSEKVYAGGTTLTYGTPEIRNCVMHGRYVNYNNADDANLLEQNYADGTLSQLSYEYFDEVPSEAVQLPSSADTVFGGSGREIEIKDTGVVTDIYVMLVPESGDQALTGGSAVDHEELTELGRPQPIDEIEFVASGQTIFSGKAKRLQLFGRVDPMGGRHHQSGSADTTGYTFANGLNNVYRLQFGQETHKNFPSGGISMRELNRPIIRVKRGAYAGHGGVGNLKARLHVILRKHSVVTVESSNGRLLSSINN
jgi:hypothetical protein